MYISDVNVRENVYDMTKEKINFVSTYCIPIRN